MIYLDNAATSWPKPPLVMQAMEDFMRNVGANPGRSGHRMSVEAGRIVNDAREGIARLFDVRDPLRVIFGLNATDGLNLGIRGLLKKGDHVITSSIEHNSVMRPLRDLEHQGIELSIAGCSNEGFLDPDDVAREIRKETRLIVVNHASNVVGSIQPIREVGRIAREHEITFLIDAAQTAGCIPIDMERDNIDLLVFTGHKGLLGPQGTGGLVIGENMDIRDLTPIRAGGTGSRSEFETQPEFLPDRYESGTMNTVGLAGLSAAVDFILGETVDAIREKDQRLTKHFLEGSRGIPGLRVYGGQDEKRQTSTVSFNIQGMSQSEIGFTLDEEYGIMCRVGLHCAPTAHRTIGTFPHGTIRFGMGYFTSEQEIDTALAALEQVVEKHGV